MDRYEIIDTAKFIAFIIGACVVGMAAFLVPIRVLDKASCAQYMETTGKATKYAILTCYIQDGGEWYNEDQYKIFLTTKALANAKGN